MNTNNTELVDVENQTEQIDDEIDVPQFIPLLDFENDYEILNQYPFTIRRRDNQYVPSEGDYRKNGYPCVKLNGKHYYKHILIAKQFISNPDNLPYIDHVNHDRSDYHLLNLRYVTASQNNRNKLSNNGFQYEYVDSLPAGAIEFTHYNQHELVNYYFHNNVFYFYNGIKYRKLVIRTDNTGNLFVYACNINGDYITVCYNQFKRLYGIPI